MVVIRVLVNVKPEASDAFVDHAKREMTEVKQKFAGCERFALYGDLVKENTFLLYEEWQTQENFDAYRTSVYFQQNGEKLYAMMADTPDSAYFTAEALPQPQG